MTIAAIADGQLDLYTEADQQRAYDPAPSNFGHAAHGFLARVEATHAWVDADGHFDCHARSHAWRAEIGGRGLDAATGMCQHCHWEGTIRIDHNAVVEYAHDPWPGSRELPIVNRRPASGTSAKKTQPMSRWTKRIGDSHPDGRLEAAGSIRTTRSRSGTRNIPDDTGLSNYDRCGQIEAERRP